MQKIIITLVLSVLKFTNRQSIKNTDEIHSDVCDDFFYIKRKEIMRNMPSHLSIHDMCTDMLHTGTWLFLPAYSEQYPCVRYYLVLFGIVPKFVSTRNVGLD